MTILDGKPMRFFIEIPTRDGQWMVAELAGGEVIPLSEFIGSEDDARTVAGAFRKRSQDQYIRESQAG